MLNNNERQAITWRERSELCTLFLSGPRRSQFKSYSSGN